MTNDQDRCPRCGGELLYDAREGFRDVCCLCWLPRKFWEEWRAMREEVEQLKKVIDRITYTERDVTRIDVVDQDCESLDG